MNSITSKEFRIPMERMPDLRVRIGKLSKKAQQLCGVPIVLTEVRAESVPHPRNRDRLLSFQVVTITGPQPKMAGWVLAGALDVMSVEGQKVSVVRSMPGEEVPSDLRSRVQDCDHCHQQRERKTLYVVRKEE